MQSRFLIVTKNMVMAEDLREILGVGNAVDVVRSLDEPWVGHYDVAFFGERIAVLLDDQRIANMRSQGTQLVVFNGENTTGADAPMNIASLSLPFTSDDVVRLFDGFGIPLSRPHT